MKARAGVATSQHRSQDFASLNAPCAGATVTVHDATTNSEETWDG